MVIGVLALQGGFEKHIEMLSNINVSTRYVKYSEDLDECSGLIIPGGESTTLSKLINKNNLYNDILKFAKSKFIFGTCAGLILLSNIYNNHVKSFKLINIDIERNGWGRQINSFSDKINLDKINSNNFEAIFIRAPKIKKINNKNIKVLSRYNEEPVLIKFKNLLGATFHPELTNNTIIHEYFISMINGKI